CARLEPLDRDIDVGVRDRHAARVDHEVVDLGRLALPIDPLAGAKPDEAVDGDEVGRRRRRDVAPASSRTAPSTDSRPWKIRGAASAGTENVWRSRPSESTVPTCCATVTVGGVPSVPSTASNRNWAATRSAGSNARAESRAVIRASASTYAPPEWSAARVSTPIGSPASNRSPSSRVVTPNGDGVKSLTRTRIG